MKRKKIFGMIAMLSLSSVVLAGCGQKKEVNGMSEKGSGDVHIAAYGSTYDNMVETAELFNAQEGHNGKVIVDQVGSDYATIIPALTSGQGIPDMIEIQSREPAQFYLNYGTEAFVDLTDIVGDKSDWVEHSYEEVVAEDGKCYAIPWNVGPCAMFYNEEDFETAEIDVSTITTYDDLIEVGKKIQETTGKYLMTVCTNGTDCNDLMMWLNQLDGQYYDEDGKVQLNSPEMKKAIELEQKLIDAGIVYDVSNAWDDRIKAINDEKISVVLTASWYSGTMLGSCEEQSGKWKIAPLPSFEEGGNRSSNLGGSAVLVSKTSKNIELCKEFLSFAMKTNEGNKINLKWGSFPSCTLCYGESYFDNGDEYFGGQKVNKIFTEYSNAPITDFGGAFNDVMNELNLVTGELYKQGADIDKILDDASEKAQSVIDAKK